MIIIVGESASGKTTLAEKIVQQNAKFHRIITWTTRPKRAGEIDGEDYNFLTEEKYRELSEQNFFIEENNYRGWFYATARRDCVDDNYTIAVLTPAGFRAIRREKISCVVFYLKVDRRSRIIKLLERGDNIEEAYRRNLSDVGQFDAVESEVDFVLENQNYRFDSNQLADQFMEIFLKLQKNNF